MSRFQEVFERVIGHEGGYSDHPSDRGGKTKFGITEAVAREAGYAGDMRNLPIELAQGIYRSRYWAPLGCEELPVGLDEFLFDYGVNSGVGTASRSLQRAVGVLPDGVVGPRTLEAAKAANPVKVLRLVFVDRAITFAKAPGFDDFARGWYARLFDKLETALKAIG